MSADGVAVAGQAVDAPLEPVGLALEQGELAEVAAVALATPTRSSSCPGGMTARTCTTGWSPRFGLLRASG